MTVKSYMIGTTVENEEKIQGKLQCTFSNKNLPLVETGNRKLTKNVKFSRILQLSMKK